MTKKQQMVLDAAQALRDYWGDFPRDQHSSLLRSLLEAVDALPKPPCRPLLLDEDLQEVLHQPDDGISSPAMRVTVMVLEAAFQRLQEGGTSSKAVGELLRKEYDRW